MPTRHALLGLIALLSLTACSRTPAESARAGFPTEAALLAAVPEGALTHAVVDSGYFTGPDEPLNTRGLSVAFGPEREDGSRLAHHQGFWTSFYVPAQNIEHTEGEGEAASRVIHADLEFYEDWPPESAGCYVDGERTGAWTFWHPDGSVRAQGRFEGDRKTGSWLAWKADGSVDASFAGEYVDDERVGSLDG